MRRRLRLCLALCGIASAASAAPAPALELTVAPAWQGWARPGRMTEIDVRVAADGAAAATLVLSGGNQRMDAALVLAPGRTLRLRVPVAAVDDLVARVEPAGGAMRQQAVALSLSERPLLAVALADREPIALDGFHAVALTAGDLPRGAAGFGAIDALVLDAPTLAALDGQQLAALLSHAAACGRVAVLTADPAVAEVLRRAAGCGGALTLVAATVADLGPQLAASLDRRPPAPLTPGAVPGLDAPAARVWQWIALLVLACLGAGVLAVVLRPTLPLLLAAPALAAAGALALTHLLPSPQALVVWGEAESGATLARYQAWQRLTGLARGQMRVEIPTLLAASAQACDPRQPLVFAFDAGPGHATTAAAPTRLFHPVSLCYAGTFPVARRLQSAPPTPDRPRVVRNAGTSGWPAGILLADGAAQRLPPLAAGDAAAVGGGPPTGADDGVVRTAAGRIPAGGVAALWPLELGGVADATPGAVGWLLVSQAAP